MTGLKIKLRSGCRVKGQTVSEKGGGLQGYILYVGGRVEEDGFVIVK